MKELTFFLFPGDFEYHHFLNQGLCGSIMSRKKSETDVLIVGAGPAEYMAYILTSCYNIII